MKRILLISLATASLAAAGLVVPSAASAAVTSSITVDFASDTAGGKPNGFVSVAAGGVAFHDTSGANLNIANFGAQSHGQGLSVGGDDASALEMRLAHPTTSLSLAFGNDDPSVATAVDKAVLTAFRGGTQVSQRTVVLNANDTMDQRITQDTGVLFDRVVFQYVSSTGTPLNLIEVVDDIRIAPLCTVAGTQGNDILGGTAGTDVICGAAGDDTISAFGGNDLVLAGSGNDTIDGGRGNDTVNGGAGNDRLLGNRGADTLRGLKGRDRLEGGIGTDRCEGGLGRDTGVSCESRSSIP